MRTREEFLADRVKGLGGSDMAAILGIDPWKQAIDVFYDKRPDLAEEVGWIAQPVEGDAAMFGTILEGAIADIYTEKTGQKVQQRHQAQEHKKHPFLRANIDRKVVGERRGLEIKHVGFRMANRWGDSGTSDVAEYYVPQVMHYLLVMDYPAWDVAALIGGSDFRVYQLERDPEWDEILVESGSKFWELVQAGTPPEIDYSHRFADDLIGRLYTNIEGSVELPESSLHLHETLKVLNDRKNDLDKAAKAIRNELLDLAGNAGRVFIPGLKGGYTRKSIHRDEYTVEASDYIRFGYSANLKRKDDE